MSLRARLPLIGLVLLATAPGCSAESPPPVAAPTADVLVYGGTPAGIAASLAAARAGRSVLLVEPYGYVGGLTTNGLSHTDFRTHEGITGTFAEFTGRVQAYY